MVLQKLGIDESSSPELVMSRLSNLLPNLTPGMRRTVGSELGINDDTLDFLSRGRGFVLDSILKAKTKPGMILSNEELDNAEATGRTRADAATSVQGKVTQAADWFTSLLQAREKRNREAEALWESSEQRDKGAASQAAPAASASHQDAVAEAERNLHIYFHGLPKGVSATAKPRGDTASPRVTTNRAGGTP
jgi:hypothetical protein